MSNSVTVEFTPTKRDHVQVSRALSIRTHSSRILLAAMIFVFVLDLALYVPIGHISLIPLILVVSFGIHHVLVAPALSGRRFEHATSLQETTQLTVDVSGINYRNKLGVKQLPWNSFSQFIETSEYYIFASGLFVSRTNPEMELPGLFMVPPAIFVPKRAFESQAHENSFLEIARGYFESPLSRQSRRVLNVLMLIGCCVAVLTIALVVLMATTDFRESSHTPRDSQSFPFDIENMRIEDLIKPTASP